MKTTSLKSFALTLVILLGIMAMLFAKSFEPDQVLFSSDGPLGAISSAAVNMKTAFRGVWQDLNWLGVDSPAALPHTSSLFWFLLGNDPVTTSKFHVPIALCALGASLWILLRQFGFRHSVCCLAAIAAALNTNSFSHACWGLPSRAWTLSSTFLALAAIRSGMISHPLLKALLAGFAVGNGIMEGFDVGAIYSIYVAAFAMFVVLAQPGKATPPKILRAAGQVAIVAVFAAICAAAGLSTLIGTQIKGIAGMEQDAGSKEKRWLEATRWSLPKIETSRVLVPGLFGYRMDTAEGGNYWGGVGQSPDDPRTRHSGAGEYAGSLVVVLAAFGVANAFKKKNPLYSEFERKTVWFFAGAALISVLLAWGRHAPFYHIPYALPYFSTIRNPIKFMHPFHMALLILFGFGVEALFRGYVKTSLAGAGDVKRSFGTWWKNAGLFEQRWTWGAIGFAAVCILGTLIYVSSRRELVAYLGTAGFPPNYAEQIATFSYKEAGLAIVLLCISIGILVLALTGWFSGRRASVLAVVMGLFLTADLMRANAPWVTYYNYKERYALNPILDFLKTDAHEHRVTAKLAPFGGRYLVSANTADFEQVANIWLQHQFQYYNIQALEPVQMPRPPELDNNFLMAMMPGPGQPPSILARMWQLSNTRYLLGDRQMISAVIPQLGLSPQDFKIVNSFDMALKPGANPQSVTVDDLTWQFQPDGRYAIFDYTNALPRAVLFSKWQITTNDQDVLKQLSTPAFDPHTMAFVDEPTSLLPETNKSLNGSAIITSYAPKHIELAVSNDVPALLVYNDKYSSNWKVKVDGNPQMLLRANYLMRGIALPAGRHQVVMSYSQSLTGLYVSLAGIFVALLVLGFVCISEGRKRNSNRTEASPA